MRRWPGTWPRRAGCVDADDRVLLDRLGARVVAVTGTMDVDGYYRSYFEKEGVAAILYRPDFYIFGSAFRAEDVPSLLRRLSSLFPFRSRAAAPDRSAGSCSRGRRS